MVCNSTTWVQISQICVTPPQAAPPKLSGINLWQGGKRLQTQVQQVAENTVTIRSLDWDRDRFDIEFGLQNGTTYNSYIIYGEDKV